MIEHPSADITDGILVEARSRTARIEWVGSAICQLVEIDISVVGEKAIGTAAQKMIAHTDRIRRVEIKIENASQYGTRVDDCKRDPRLGNIPSAGINTPVDSKIDVGHGSEFHVQIEV